MKIELHVPVEQYGFVSASFEIDQEGAFPADQTRTTYEAIANAFKEKTGISDKEFQAFLIRQLLQEGGNHIEEYNAMSPIQQKVVQEVKKSLATLKRRNEN